jgi:hypothetical protein
MEARGCPRCRGTDCLPRGGLPRRRGAYLRPDLREDLDSYLLARTWALYLKFDPAKASTPLSLSTYLTRRLNFAISDWFRSTFSDRRYNSRYVVKEVSSLDVELEQEHDLPAEDDSVSILPSLSDTGVGVGSVSGSSTRRASRSRRSPRTSRPSSTSSVRFAPRGLLDLPNHGLQDSKRGFLAVTI